MTKSLLLALAGLALGVVAGLAIDRAPRAAPRVAGPMAAAELPTRFPGLPASLAAEEQARSLPRKLEALLHPVRQHQLPPAAILAELGVQPGMTIVDIGAGGGHLSFPLARAVTPTGRVYATDVDDRLVPLLQERAVREGVASLTAVLVGPDFDPFYRDKQFDLVIMCSVFEYLRSPSAFFRQLRPTVRAGSGRLAVLQGRTSATYFPTDFGASFRSADLLAEGPASPVGRRVPAALLERHAAGGIDADGMAALADAFNRLLDDPRLLGDLTAFAAATSPGHRDLFAGHGFDDVAVVRWIYRHFDATGLWDAPPATLSGPERNAVRTVNWLALLPRFRDGLPREIFARGIYLTPAGITRRLEAEGFRLVRSVTTLPAHDFLVFAPDRIRR